MLSLGTEFDFALATASASVGLPVGSPPPARADTSMVLISLANSLPRRASTTAFLCLVVAHLECPLIVAPRHLARSGGCRGPSRRRAGAPGGHRSVPDGMRWRAGSPAGRR